MNKKDLKIFTRSQLINLFKKDNSERDKQDIFIS